MNVHTDLSFVTLILHASVVVQAVMAALDTEAPRLRYPVAMFAQRFLVSLRSVLPQRWFEAMLLDYFKMR